MAECAVNVNLLYITKKGKYYYFFIFYLFCLVNSKQGQGNNIINGSARYTKYVIMLLKKGPFLNNMLLSSDFRNVCLGL